MKDQIFLHIFILSNKHRWLNFQICEGIRTVTRLRWFITHLTLKTEIGNVTLRKVVSIALYSSSFTFFFNYETEYLSKLLQSINK